jgi:hypothetical protein
MDVAIKSRNSAPRTATTCCKCLEPSQYKAEGAGKQQLHEHLQEQRRHLLKMDHDESDSESDQEVELLSESENSDQETRPKSQDVEHVSTWQKTFRIDQHFIV